MPVSYCPRRPTPSPGVATQDEPVVQSVMAALIVAAANQTRKVQHMPASLGTFPDIHYGTKASMRVLRLRARLASQAQPDSDQDRPETTSDPLA